MQNLIFNSVLACTLLANISLGCDSDSSGEGSIQGNDYITFLKRECLKKSVCNSDTLVECMSELNTDDSYELDGQFWRKGLRERASCVSQASNCESFNACVDGYTPEDQTATCTIENYSRCISATEYVWCISNDEREDDETWQGPKFDLTELGYTCKDGAIDYDNAGSCDSSNEDEGISRKWCEGSKIMTCKDGNQSELECGLLAPNYTCRDDSPDGTEDNEKVRCGLPALPTPCIDNNNYDNYGGIGTCDGDVAQICLDGSLHQIDCKQFDSAKCTNATASNSSVANATCSVSN
jgi:hypothetical protein